MTPLVKKLELIGKMDGQELSVDFLLILRTPGCKEELLANLNDEWRKASAESQLLAQYYSLLTAVVENGNVQMLIGHPMAVELLRQAVVEYNNSQ